MTAATTDMGARARAARKRSASSQLALKAWGFMSPAMALLLSMTVVPTLYLVYYAFRHEDLLGARPARSRRARSIEGEAVIAEHEKQRPRRQ